MNTIENIEQTIKKDLAVMLYFSASVSTSTCSVDSALKVKLLDAIDKNFEEFTVITIDTSLQQKIAVHFGVFVTPTVLIFLDGKEFLRKSRHMSINELVREIKRPYDIMIS